MNEKPSTLADAAVSIAIEAGKLLMADLPLGRFQGDIEDKGDGELVSRVDRASEALIRNRVADAYPHHAVLGEEGGESSHAAASHRWIVDPLDGTTNYLHGHPFFAVSIAVEHEGEIVAGAVHVPYFQETYFAAQGEGAFLNTRAIALATSETRQLGDALVASGFAYDRQRYANFDNFVRIAKAARGVRRCGSAAIDLAFVACGRYDAFWELGLRAWDVAAGSLLVKEAGGVVCDFAGGAATLDAGNVVASNQHLATAVRGLLDRPPHIGG